MGYHLWAITKMEFNRLRKSWIYGCCLFVVLIVPFVVDNPLRDGRLRSPVSAAYSSGYGLSLIVSFLIPFLMTTLFYYDERTNMLKILFTQPIKPITYALGKFAGSFIAISAMILVGLVIHMLFPIFIGESPYFSSSFFTVMMVYILPSIFYFSAFCYFILIVFKTPIITAIAPVFYIVFSGEWPSAGDYLMRGRDLSLLRRGMSQTLLDISYLAPNRLLFISLGVLFLGGAILLYSLKRR